MLALAQTAEDPERARRHREVVVKRAAQDVAKGAIDICRIKKKGCGQVVLSNRGICIDTAVYVRDKCRITCEVVGDQAQFLFDGGDRANHELVISEESLELLAHMSTAALAKMRADLEGQVEVPETSD
jgi:hypothetical protein